MGEENERGRVRVRRRIWNGEEELTKGGEIKLIQIFMRGVREVSWSVSDSHSTSYLLIFI